jgi:hypothetical protein
MKKMILFLMIALLGYSPQSWAQKKSTTAALFVPYKVKDKFGIATQKGNLVLPPQFDYVSLNYAPNFFTCYTYGSNKTYQTSLVVNDKIILSNQPFFEYYNYQGIVFAVKEAGGKGSGYYSLRPEEIQLFTLKGKKITPEGFSHVSTFEEIDKEDKLAQVLLYLIHKDKTYSLVLYDKKTQSITTKLVDKAIDIEFQQLEMLYQTKELHVKYIDSQNKGHELKISSKGTSFVKTYEGTYVVQPASRDYTFDDHNVVVPDWESEKAPKISFTESEIQSKRINLQQDYQFYQPSKLIIKPQKLDPKYQKITFENGKKGLLNTYENKVTLPTVYDDFYSADFKGIHANGFVLKQEGKYRLKVYNFGGKESPVNGVFDYIPMITFYEYGKKDFHLISLFDEQGNFVCYANQEGVVYRSE